jgi:hypothetical protein
MTPGDPFAANTLTSVQVFGIEVKRGDRVRLWPQRQADIFDMALAGKLATVEAIEQTVEDEVYLAVTVDDDPGSDLGNLRQIGHRFFFRVEEIEPIMAEEMDKK